MLKPKLQYFAHLMWRTDSFEKTLMLGKIEGGRRRGWRRVRWLDGITDSIDMSLSRLWSWWWTRMPGVLQSMGLQRVGHDWATELNWMATPREENYVIKRTQVEISKILKVSSKEVIKKSPLIESRRKNAIQKKYFWLCTQNTFGT